MDARGHVPAHVHPLTCACACVQVELKLRLKALCCELPPELLQSVATTVLSALSGKFFDVDLSGLEQAEEAHKAAQKEEAERQKAATAKAKREQLLKAAADATPNELA